MGEVEIETILDSIWRGGGGSPSLPLISSSSDAVARSMCSGKIRHKRDDCEKGRTRGEKAGARGGLRLRLIG